MPGYDFEIIYKKGKHNIVVDALSRKEDEIKGSLFVVFVPKSIGWKKQEYNGSKIKRHARSFNNYKRTPVH
jgi:hypothetical protein